MADLSATETTSVVTSLIFKSSLSTCSKSSRASSPEEFQSKFTRNEFGMGLNFHLGGKLN